MAIFNQLTPKANDASLRFVALVPKGSVVVPTTTRFIMTNTFSNLPMILGPTTARRAGPQYTERRHSTSCEVAQFSSLAITRTAVNCKTKPSTPGLWLKRPLHGLWPRYA